MRSVGTPRKSAGFRSRLRSAATAHVQENERRLWYLGITLALTTLIVVFAWAKYFNLWADPLALVLHYWKVSGSAALGLLAFLTGLAGYKTAKVPTALRRWLFQKGDRYPRYRFAVVLIPLLVGIGVVSTQRTKPLAYSTREDREEISRVLRLCEVSGPRTHDAGRYVVDVFVGKLNPLQAYDLRLSIAEANSGFYFAWLGAPKSRGGPDVADSACVDGDVRYSPTRADLARGLQVDVWVASENPEAATTLLVELLDPQAESDADSVDAIRIDLQSR